MTQLKTSKRTSCAKCPFYGAKVGTRGPEDSPFMIVGESPGREELKEGLPFVGKSWEVLQHAIKLSNVASTYVEPYITNAMHCWPGTAQKTEERLNLAAACCHSQLVEEINRHPRKVLLVIGNPALRSVTNNFGLKITQNRGKYIRDQLCKEITSVEHALATIHPAFILRGGGNYRQFRGDIRYALQLLTGGDVRRNPSVDFYVIRSEFDLHRLHKRLTRESALAQQIGGLPVAADIETGSDPGNPNGPGGFNHIDDAILSLAISFREDAVYIIPEDLITHPATAALCKIPNLRWIWHNGKFDIKFLWSYGITSARVDEDTMLMSYTLDERRGVHDLEEVSHDWLASPRWKGMLDKFVKKGQSYRVIPKATLYEYQAYDTSNTLRLHKVMEPEILTDAHNRKLYYRTLIPASAYLARVEDRGIKVDFAAVKSNERRLIAEAMKHSEPLFEMALNTQDQAFNEKMINSPLQLAKLLYDHLKIPSKVRSTADAVLDELPPHPAVVHLRNYRKVYKQLSTYVRPLYTGCSSDGRIHSQYKIHGTATGRLASGDPINMQNIPRDADIRGQFIPTPGYIFVEPDLNQAELRSLAAMSQDPLLTQIYKGESNEGGVHDVMRRRMYGDPEEWSHDDIARYRAKFFIQEGDPAKALKAILDEQKMKAKNVNFGIIYGITEFGLADQLESSYQEAREMLRVWRETFPVAWRFIRQCMQAPQRGQNLVTVFGNRKRHHVVTPENVHNLEKEAANFLHQATASHIVLHACMRLHEHFAQKYDAHFVNMMHDGALIECPDNYTTIIAVAQEVMAMMEYIPRDFGITHIPFVADAKVGYRWGRNHMTEFSEWKRLHQQGKLQDAG